MGLDSWIGGWKARGTQIPEIFSSLYFGVQFHESQSQELTGLDGFLYPVRELAEVGVDAWHVRLATLGLSKGHKALQGPVADQGAPGVTLLWRDRE